MTKQTMEPVGSNTETTPGEKVARSIVLLPFFPGFYESMLSSAIDNAEEQAADYDAEKEASEEYYPETYQPEHLRITKDEFALIYFHCTNYQATYLKVAQFWVEAFDLWCKENLGTPEKSFTFESMHSPREYNFTTNWVFAHVPVSVLETMFAMSAANKHEVLAQTIKNTFTSYDGFSSFYSNALEVWLEKPLGEWDHNELGTLVAAAIIASDEWKDRGEFSMALYESVFSGNGEEDEARAVDWDKYEAKAKALRAKKLEEHNAEKSND